jgi:hypothetical protein
MQMAISIAPASTARAVTPHDTNTIGGCRALYVGGAGNLVLDFADGQNNVTLSAVPAGTVIPVAALRVKVATTATLIVALY